MTTSDKLQLIGWASFFGFIFYYVIFRAPGSDKVYSSDTEANVHQVKAFLDKNGIRTYIKSRSPYRLKTYGGLANPSVHVLDPGDRERALFLIQHMSSDLQD